MAQKTVIRKATANTPNLLPTINSPLMRFPDDVVQANDRKI